MESSPSAASAGNSAAIGSSLRRAQYEAVRGDPRRFVIALGHVVAELEHVVETHPEHAVVQTHPHTAAFAEHSDPRSARTH